MTLDMDQSATPSELTPTLGADLKENRYFPTQVFSYKLPDAEAAAFNETLLCAIREERRRDRDGIQRSNFRSLGGWHSHNSLHKDARFEKMVSLIDTCTQAISEKNGYHPGHRLAIGTMWAITNPPGSFNRSHIHPSSQWSGVYYVQAPEGAGAIDFTDPRTEHLMTPMRYVPNRKRPKACWTKVNFVPEPGKMLIFPSWLYHSVAPNLSTLKDEGAERVIVSFNLAQRKREDVPPAAADGPSAPTGA
jgi:uncharacterized protein (TIGR02466 family)